MKMTDCEFFNIWESSLETFDERNQVFIPVMKRNKLLCCYGDSDDREVVVVEAKAVDGIMTG